jgi:hypothetical protein
MEIFTMYTIVCSQDSRSVKAVKTRIEMLRAHALKPNSLQRGKIHSGIILLEPSSFVVRQVRS